MYPSGSRANGCARFFTWTALCNECGNCAVFCPYTSRPYRDKFTLFWSLEDFQNSENDGFLRLEGGAHPGTPGRAGEGLRRVQRLLRPV